MLTKEELNKGVSIVGLDSNLTYGYCQVLQANDIKINSVIIVNGYELKPTLKYAIKQVISKSLTNIPRKLVEKKFKESFNFPYRIESFFSPRNYEKLSQNVLYVSAESINDPEVVSAIKQSTSELFVFSGGGIVRKEVLDTDKRFIHCHPGLLPQVRGSHATYWSLLISGSFGCTAFFMSAGIDEGAVLITREFNKQHYPKLRVFKGRKEDFLNFYVDPLLRLSTFESLLKEVTLKRVINPTDQDLTRNMAFNKMHERLRRYVVERFL